jgi:hypothetical protein
MTIGNPAQPARHGRLTNTEADIYAMTAATGDGGIGYGTFALAHSSIPCVFQAMNSSESQRWGATSSETLYEAYLPTVSMDGTDISVSDTNAKWQVRIAGTTYEVLGAGVKQRDGMQKLALRRVSG